MLILLLFSLPPPAPATYHLFDMIQVVFIFWGIDQENANVKRISFSEKCCICSQTTADCSKVLKERCRAEMCLLTNEPYSDDLCFHLRCLLLPSALFPSGFSVFSVHNIQNQVIYCFSSSILFCISCYCTEFTIYTIFFY